MIIFPACRPALLVAAAIWLVSAWSIAAEPAAATNESAIRTALSTKSPVDFQETPLVDVVGFLADRHKINIVIDRRALEDVGLGTDCPVTLNLQHANLQTVLRLALKPNDLTHVIRHEVLEITTPEEAEETLQTRVYNVVDLVDQGDDIPAYSSRYDSDALIALILAAVEPTTWDEVGGRGTIQAAAGMLVIAQTESCHDKIARLLKTVRKAVNSKPGDSFSLVVSGPQPPLAVLEKPVSLEFVELPLSDAVDLIREAAGVDVRIDRRALDDVGISDDVPVTVRAGEIPLKTFLRTMLRPLDLTWTWVDNVLLLTTPEEAECHLSVQLHNVRDLVMPEQADPEEPLADHDTIIELIYDAVAPTTWDVVGGPGATEPYKHLLIVSQTPQVHAEVEWLLQLLRADFAEPEAVIGHTGEMARALRQKISLDFVDTPLTDVFSFIADKHAMSIQVDVRALGDVGLDADELDVTLRVSDISIKSVLALMLDQFDLTWMIDGGKVLVITTPEEADSRMILRAFYVADLMGEEGLSAEKLTDLVSATVVPENWVDAGGAGTLRVFRDRLVVLQNEQVADKVADLLVRLRDARARVEP